MQFLETAEVWIYIIKKDNIFRTAEKTALLLFKNGKVICTGSKTEADIHRAIDIMIKTVQKYILVPQNDEDEKK